MYLFVCRKARFCSSQPEEPGSDREEKKKEINTKCASRANGPVQKFSIIVACSSQKKELP